jgi:hypothetical protein
MCSSNTLSAINNSAGSLIKFQHVFSINNLHTLIHIKTSLALLNTAATTIYYCSTSAYTTCSILGVITVVLLVLLQLLLQLLL